ncbi:CPBP family intramembrane metalloprotease [Candidatus Roizmanbacteria bacterium]|nr:CPBP family intramembrane metalloprotease [Candidatus Roizmanbacteria bacterium]
MKDKKVTPTQRALNLWAVILILWSIYRTYLKLPEWFDEFIAKPLVFVLPVFIYIKWVEKKGILSSLFINKNFKNFVKEFSISLGVGLILLLTALLSVYLRFKKIELFGNFPSFNQLTLIFITALATGITEEILSRGFVLKRLYEESKNAYSSTFFASILFFFLHVPILFASNKINGSMLLVFMVTDLLLSMVTGLIMIQRKSLTVPILIHTFYNVVVALSFI